MRQSRLGDPEYGGLLAALQDYPMLLGVLFDLPDVVPQASDRLTHAGLAARCEFVAGDFFVAVPAGGDARTSPRI